MKTHTTFLYIIFILPSLLAVLQGQVDQDFLWHPDIKTTRYQKVFKIVISFKIKTRIKEMIIGFS